MEHCDSVTESNLVYYLVKVREQRIACIKQIERSRIEDGVVFPPGNSVNEDQVGIPGKMIDSTLKTESSDASAATRRCTPRSARTAGSVPREELKQTESKTYQYRTLRKKEATTMASRTYKDLFGGGYTTYHDNGTTSHTYKNLFGGGYTTYHSNGSTSRTYKDTFGGGKTTYHSNGTKSHTYKDLFGGGYTTYHSDGSKTHSHKNLFGNGYTSYRSKW